MKLIAVFLLVSCFSALSSANRAKRFSGFGGLSTVGGHVGCVVSDNKLFINGRYTKELTDSEQEELDQYKKSQDQFREDVKKFIEERQKQLRQGGSPSDNEMKTKKPEPPKKPSFCSDKATTQYVFDGCSVQGDSIYIGNNFVRKLTTSEQTELEQFDKQFTAYQKQVTSNFRSQVEDIFGKHFGQLFGAPGSSKSQDGSVAIEASSEAPVTAAAPLEPPKTPNFCTLII